MIKKIREIFKAKNNDFIESNEILGDGGAVFFSEGSYEDYENELETSKEWRNIIKRRLNVN